MNLVSVVTWNIHGGVSVNGGLIAVAESLEPQAPDLVALQEFPHKSVGSITGLAADLGLSHSIYWEVGSEDRTGLAIISRWPLKNSRCLVADAPPKSITSGSRGLTAHRKGALVVDVQRGQNLLRFASVHLLPFHIFGLAEDRVEARQIWAQLASGVVDGAPGGVIIGGDFNGPPVLRLSPPALRNVRAQSAIDVRSTRDDGRSHDDVLFSSEFQARDVHVIETESDHHLCAITLLELEADT